MELRPLGNRILVRRDDPAEKFGALHIPEEHQQRADKVMTGTVVSVGTGRRLKSGQVIPIELKPGDRIALERQVGMDVRVGDDVLWVVRMEYVFGKFTD